MEETREIDKYKDKHYTGRNLRLFREWETIDKRFAHDPDISYLIRKKNADGLPVNYEVTFNVHSFSGVSEPDEKGLYKPLFADVFKMNINIPNNYPSADSKLEFKFRTEDVFGKEISHPWHPNIRYFGSFAGRVCLNTKACGTYSDLSWYIDRVMSYLKYERYHALNTPPFPEDNKVAEWVLEQAEPNGWINQLRESYK